MFSTPQQLDPEDFPPLLAEIPDPPESLRLAGKLPDLSRRWLAVVGSRKASPYGLDACRTLIEGLAGAPFVIVSGLAFGIDAAAHKAALAVNLPTVAVPGSGLSEEVLYPAAHRRLAHDILEAGGALLSEYADDFRAAPWSFPKRNRIMVGLSHAVLVIEAEQRSGTLITARLASEYNRDVLAVPGPIFSPTSTGPLSLIKLGATPIAESADILDAFDLTEAVDAGSSGFEMLTPDEQEVVALLAAPCSRDALFRQLDRPASDVNQLLTSLELKGVVVEQYGELRLRRRI